MTTTHTFQGLNTDSKPSSRVLNPPGGSSSNIFGCDDQLKQKSSAKTVTVAREKTGTTDHDLPASTTGQQQQSGATRSGDDSFPSPFGIYQSLGCDKAQSNNRDNPPFPSVALNRINDSPGRLISRSKYSKTDTFKNIFGEGTVQYRKMCRRIHHFSDDSFSRVFGQTSLGDCKEVRIPSPAVHVNSSKYDSSNVKSGDTRDSSYYLSQSNYNSTGTKFETVGDENKAVNRMVYKNGSFRKPVPLSRRFPQKSAFNPITGEPYEQSKPKHESHNPAILSNTCLNKTTVDSCAGTGIVETNSGSVSTIVPGKPQPVPADPPVQQKQHHTGGLFGGGSDGVKEHRSTRVSQPPGGHSTKLW